MKKTIPLQAEFSRCAKRRIALRITDTELAKAADINYVTYWRAKSGKTRQLNSRLVVLRKLEATLDRLEAANV